MLIMSFLRNNWELALEIILVGVGFILVEKILLKGFSFHIFRKSHQENSPLKNLEMTLLGILRPFLRAFLASFALFLLIHFGPIPLKAVPFIQEINHSLFILLFFGAFHRMTPPVFHFLDRWGGHDLGYRFSNELRSFISNVTQVVVVVFGLLSLLGAWHIDTSTFLAGLGLVGVAVSFSAQESIKQFFGGIALIMDRPFQEGDWICSGDLEGVVEKVGLRSTKIRQFDNALVVVPNGDLSNVRIKNMSAVYDWMISCIVTLPYATSIETLCRIEKRLQEYVKNHKDVDHEKYTGNSRIGFYKFSESSIDISCTFYTTTKDWMVYSNLQGEFLIAFKKIVEEEGGFFALPSRSVYLDPGIFPLKKGAKV